MKTEDLAVGDIYVYDGYTCVTEAEIVEVIKIYFSEVSVKPLGEPDSEIFKCHHSDLLTLEEADHELFLRIKQAETLRQEVKAQLHLKLCQ
jgi:hypothetical protein